MYLITYMVEVTGIQGKRQHYAYEIHEDPIQFILECQEYSETYYLINAQRIPEEHYSNEYIQSRNLKGM